MGVAKVRLMSINLGNSASPAANLSGVVKLPRLLLRRTKYHQDRRMHLSLYTTTTTTITSTTITITSNIAANDSRVGNIRGCINIRTYF